MRGSCTKYTTQRWRHSASLKPVSLKGGRQRWSRRDSGGSGGPRQRRIGRAGAHRHQGLLLACSCSHQRNWASYRRSGHGDGPAGSLRGAPQQQARPGGVASTSEARQRHPASAALRPNPKLATAAAPSVGLYLNVSHVREMLDCS